MHKNHMYLIEFNLVFNHSDQLHPPLLFLFSAAKDYLDNIKRVQQTQEGESDEDDAVAERLRQDALDAMGHYRRKIAHRITLPPLPLTSDFNLTTSGGRFLRGPSLPVTATALTHDESTVFAVSKDGSIYQYDVETGKKTRFGLSLNKKPSSSKEPVTGTADWIRPAARQANRCGLLSAAVSSDGRYFATGGGDKKVHVYDVRSGDHLRAFPGHKDAVTCLTFREGTHQLYSGSLDRSIKLWSLEDMAYVDTLFGHQAEVLALDALRAERALSCGADRTCRVWKIAEESQLVFRGHCLTIESAAYVTGGEWITGSADGSVQFWRSTKKKPVFSARDAHGVPKKKSSGNRNTRNTTAVENSNIAAEEGLRQEVEEEQRGAGSVGGAAATWVGSVAVCRGSDLAASGSADGVIHLWKIPDASGRVLTPIGEGLPVRGFVNSLQIGKSGKVLVAGVGQEPRMGRWLRDAKAKNGVVIYRIPMSEETEEDREGADEEDEDELVASDDG
jgi:ribosomal RNA-processing protein 9